MDVKGEEIDLVAELLSMPFSRRTFKEKMGIVKKGRTTPMLARLAQPGKGCVRHFHFNNYARYPWLTGSEEHCKLYCWECLLFATDRCGVWSHTGFANLTCLTKAATRHQSTAGHLHATVLSRTFVEASVDLQPSEHERREMEVHNEKVKKNREILKRLIDCVVFWGKRGRAESGGSTCRADYVELLALVAESNADLHYHLSTNEVFSETSGRIQNDLIAAVAAVMAEEIKSEVSKAPFVSVLMEETSDASDAARFALALRYVTGTGVKERFVRFEDVSGGKRADDIAGLIIRFLQENECLGKVVAQCFDGASVTSSGINEVQAKVKETAPLALFIHSCAHPLNVVLTQGASKLKDCKIFFGHLNGLAAFFSRSPWRTKLLENICQHRLPGVAPARWQDSSTVVSVVFEMRDALTELFHQILEHHDEYDEDTVRCADQFNACLGDLQFCFLLHMFNGIFGYSDMFFSSLQDKQMDVELCLARVTEFCDTLERDRSGFEELYEAAECTARAPRGQAQDLRAHHRQLHASLLDNVICQTRTRFQDHEKLMFITLLNPQKFWEYSYNFPHTAFASLTQNHGTLFDLPRLKTELTVMYGMDGFAGKSPTDLLDFIVQKNLSESMGQLCTLLCLAVTIPVSAATGEQTFTALKRIKSYVRNMTGQARHSALASLAIEKEFLMELKRTDKLYDRVMEVFLMKERRMDFIYK